MQKNLSASILLLVSLALRASYSKLNRSTTAGNSDKLTASANIEGPLRGQIPPAPVLPASGGLILEEHVRSGCYNPEYLFRLEVPISLKGDSQYTVYWVCLEDGKPKRTWKAEGSLSSDQTSQIIEAAELLRGTPCKACSQNALAAYGGNISLQIAKWSRTVFIADEHFRVHKEMTPELKLFYRFRCNPLINPLQGRLQGADMQYECDTWNQKLEHNQGH